MKLRDFRNAIFLHEYENDKKEIVLKFLKDIDETEESLCHLYKDKIENGEVQIQDDFVALSVDGMASRRIWINKPEELNLGE